MGRKAQLVTFLFCLLLVLPIMAYSQMTIKLVENERYSPFDARAILELTTPAILSPSSTSLTTANFNFSLDRYAFKVSNKLDTVKQADMGLISLVEIDVNKSERIDTLGWRKVTYNMSICPNKTKDDCYNEETVGEESYPVSYIKNYTVKEWIPLSSITMKPSSKYRVKLESHNLDKNLNYDWILTSEGITYKQWDWWNNSFIYEQKIQINATNTGALTYFPVRLIVDTATLIAAGKMNNTCKDLRIADSTKTYMLAYEIENNTCNTAGTVVWFALNLTQTTGVGMANTTAYLYYGSNLTSDSQNPHLLWNQSGYVRVFHFGEATLPNGTNKSVEESTQWADHASTGISAPTPFLNTTSKFGYSLYYGTTRSVAGRYVNFTNPNLFTKTAGTFELWALDWLAGTTTESGLFSSYALVAVPYGAYGVADEPGGDVSKYGYVRGTAWSAQTAVLNSKTWTLISMENNGTNGGSIYINGTLKASGSGDTPADGHNRIAIGAGGGFERATPSNSFAGFIDEFRVSTESKTADWNKANYGMVLTLEPVTVLVTTPTITALPANQTLNFTNSASRWANVTITVTGVAANLTVYVLGGANMTVWTNTSSLTNFLGSVIATVQINTTYYAQGQIPVVLYVNSTTAGAINKSATINANITFVSVCTSGFAYSHIRVGSPLYVGENVLLSVFYANEFGIPISPTTCRLLMTDSDGTTVFNRSMIQLGTGLFITNYTFTSEGDYLLSSNCECESVTGTDAGVVHIANLKDTVKAIVKYEERYNEQYEVASGVSAPIASFGFMEISLGLGVLIAIALLLYNAYKQR